MKKKALFGLIALGGLFAVSFANEGGSSSRSTVNWNANFTAKYQDGVVQTQWNTFKNPTSKSFSYYKVVRSQEKANPVYPDDGYIAYISDVSTNSYTDKDVKNGKNYYRVCAILEGQVRYCSNVVALSISTSNTTVQKEEIKKEVKVVEKKNNYEAVDKLAAEFLKKLDQKFGTDTAGKQTAINAVLVGIDALIKSRPSMKDMLTYLKTKLQQQKTELDEIKALLGL